MPVFPGPVCRHLHFPKLNNICHFSDHLTKLSMSSCNFCLFPISLVFLNSLLSSANLKSSSSKSSMYTKNKIGPSTDPWGTPSRWPKHTWDLPKPSSYQPRPPFHEASGQATYRAWTLNVNNFLNNTQTLVIQISPITSWSALIMPVGWDGRKWRVV